MDQASSGGVLGLEQVQGRVQGRGGGRVCRLLAHCLPLQVVASVVDQDSFSGFAPLQPQVSLEGGVGGGRLQPGQGVWQNGALQLCCSLGLWPVGKQGCMGLNCSTGLCCVQECRCCLG